MTVLLDTHVLLWAASTPERLSDEVLSLIEDPATEVVFSAASLWEIAIKSGLGRRDFNVDPRVLRRCLVENDYTELPVRGTHAVAVDLLPSIHKDPFDRMLVAQSLTEGFTLLTADKTLGLYPGPIRVL